MKSSLTRIVLYKTWAYVCSNCLCICKLSSNRKSCMMLGNLNNLNLISLYFIYFLIIIQEGNIIKKNNYRSNYSNVRHLSNIFYKKLRKKLFNASRQTKSSTGLGLCHLTVGFPFLINIFRFFQISLDKLRLY